MTGIANSEEECGGKLAGEASRRVEESRNS